VASQCAEVAVVTLQFAPAPAKRACGFVITVALGEFMKESVVEAVLPLFEKTNLIN
jgi:hypothetical protein